MCLYGMYGGTGVWGYGGPTKIETRVSPEMGAFNLNHEPPHPAC